MTAPEIALTYLVVIWTLLFFGLAAGIFVLVRKAQMGLDLVNSILLTTKDVARNVAEPINIIAKGVSQTVGHQHTPHVSLAVEPIPDASPVPALPLPSQDPSLP